MSKELLGIHYEMQKIVTELDGISCVLQRTNELLEMVLEQNEITQPELMGEDEDAISKVLRGREERMNSTGPS